ncbi:MAG TPA: serine/threonine-protein kinase [Ktedonobacteraceae bacterium]|nr:serine/threonine-protein kinase [Ktedonobacteraceae bacterium]
MQSTASTWFCPTCGAANEIGESVCFSCKRARVEAASQSAAGDEDELLHGRYRLLAQVGMGGFGEVYKALDTQNQGRIVAIKQINLRGLSPQKTIEATDTFNRELHILAPLHHPNLPGIFDHFTDPDHWYLVMEFIEGETLERFLEERLKQRIYGIAQTLVLLPLEDIFALALQLCEVLDYLHGQHPPIIFRDLKPANIMQTGPEHIYLIDFGIARFFTPGRAKDTTPLGSPGYAAPEQYGRAQTTAQSDLYSLGALLHYLLTGNDPSDTPFQFAPLPLLSQTAQAATQELQTLIRHMVEMDSSQRPASAREVKEVLQRIASLVKQSAAPRLWSPPPGLPPDPKVEGALQQQVQMHLHLHKTSTRRKFLRNSLIGGTVLVLVGGVVVPVLASIAHEQRSGSDVSTPPPPQTVSDIVWSPDGTQVAIAYSRTVTTDGSSYTTGALYLNPVGQGPANLLYSAQPGISALAWSPDGTLIAFSATGSNVITVMNTSNRGIIIEYPASIGQVENIAWSPDGTLIASTGWQEVLRISKARNGSTVSTYAGNSAGEKRFLSWSPDSTRVVTRYDPPNIQASSSTLQVWDARGGKILFTFGALDMLQVAWSPDGHTIASVSVNGVISLYNALNGEIIKSYIVQENNILGVEAPQPVSLFWSPDSTYLTLDNGAAQLQIWNVKNDHTTSVAANFDPPRAARWLPNGQFTLIDGSNDTNTIDIRGL